MKNGKKNFFTEKFYSDSKITLNILNTLVKCNYVTDKEMYQNGTFLFMEIYENDKTKAILSKVICDFKAYKEYNNKKFINDESTQISLCALQDEHTKYFKNENEIKWNNNLDRFVFSSVLHNQ